MSIRELTPVLLKKAKDELGEVPSRIPNDIMAIKEWLAKQPHINANLDDQWILAFLRGCKFSLERTKQKLETFYTSKTLAPEISMAEDPADQAFLDHFRLGGAVALKEPVSDDGPIVFILRPGALHSDVYSVEKSMQICQMIIEVLMLENDNITVAGVKYISDLQNLSMRHLTQVTPVLGKKLVLCAEKAFPLRQKGAHQVNFPAGIESIFNFLIKFFSEKLQKRIYIHSQMSETLYEHIPKKCLPTEYGGDAGPISDCVDFWEKKLLSYRDYFIKSKQFKTDESKRRGKPKSASDEFGIEGSFRSLTVD